MKNISKFSTFIYENYEDNQDLIYYSFDIDDNLLHMPTRIHMEHLVDGKWITEIIDTEYFAKIRNDKINWRYKPDEESFMEFRDFGKDGDDTFLKGFKYAVIKKDFGPSWNKFIECLVNGNIFSIITSRGHSPENIKRAIEWLIYEYGLDKFKNLNIKNVNKFESFEDQMIQNLLKYHELFGTSPDYVIDEYLDACPIYPISSIYFKNKFGKMTADDAKKTSLKDFNDIVKKYARILGVKAKYGFSDDDPKFVKAAVDQFRELKKRNKGIKYSVYDTGNRKINKFKI